MKQRILIVGANPYNANKGVAALAISTIRLLNNISQENNFNLEICIYTHESTKVYDTISLPEGNVHIQNIFPSNIWGGRNILNTITSRWKLYNLRELLKCDYILNLTAGDSFSDIYGVDNFNSLNRINKFSKLFHKKYSFLPQTYGPFYEKKSLNAALKSLKGADLIMSRDSKSTLWLKENLPNTKIYDLIDVAFYLPYKKIIQQQNNTLNIGINISETLWNKSKDSKFSITPNYRELTIKLIKELLRRQYRVHIVPHVVNCENDSSNEYYLSYHIWNEINHPNLILSPLFLSPIDAKSYISGLDLFIGARMHACIAAFSSNVPIIPLSYSRKFSGLFTDTLNYPNIIRLDQISDIKPILKMTEYILSNLNNIKTEITNTNNTIIKSKLIELKSLITSILRKRLS